MSENTARKKVAGADAPATAGIVSLGRTWLLATLGRGLVLIELALAEAKLAAVSLALMLFLSMLAAAFVFVAWVLFLAAGLHMLMQNGLPLGPTLFVVGGAHLAAATILWRLVIRSTDDLEFQATRRQFEGRGESAR